jgi:hypothetical protein
MPIKWDFERMRWEGLTEAQVELWEKLYPDCDVIDVLRFDIPRWLEKKKGTKISHKKNWHTTICNWLKKEQMKAVGIL